MLEKGAETQAINDILICAVESGSLKTIQYFVENFSILNSNNGYNALITAIKNGSLDIVKYLIEKNNIDLRKKNPIGWDVFKYAVYYERFDIVKFFNNLNKGYFINRKDEFENTPLIYAIIKRNFKMVKYLIENGAIINFKTRYAPFDEESINYFLDFDYFDHQDLLLFVDLNEKYISLMYAVKYRDYDIVKYLIQKGALINYINRKGNTPLILAVKNWDYKITKFLLRNGANANLAYDSCFTPLKIILLGKNRKPKSSNLLNC